MPQDFARQIDQSSVLNGARRGAGNGRVLKRSVVYSAGLFLFVAFVLALFGRGGPVNASVPELREEWLACERPLADAAEQVRRVVLRPGDAAATALGELGFPFAEVVRMSQAAKPVHSLRDVLAGHAFRRVDRDHATHVYYNVDSEQVLHLSMTQEDGEWHAGVETRQYLARQRVVSGVIEGSLFEAAAAAGLDEHTTMNMVDIFAWDIDFARDLRAGDRFSVLFEERFDEQGKMIGSSILAAEFINDGTRYQAIRHLSANGRVDYFAPDGHSMRKTYLKSPVKFSRISSRFSTHRKHPVLGYTRAHRGVDYAAPSGTPIRAIGDGRVVMAGWKGGYGRYVEIRHTNSAHSTAYAHLRAYGKGIRKGRIVKQGQIIGYVGQSGLATGPHLHFEFRVRGRAVNPLTVRHAPAKPVPQGEMVRFQAEAEALIRRLAISENRENWG